MAVRHRERHRTDRIGWLRAAVLGANDGIVSTASLVLGVAAAHATHSNVMIAGIAGLMARPIQAASSPMGGPQRRSDRTTLVTGRVVLSHTRVKQGRGAGDYFGAWAIHRRGVERQRHARRGLGRRLRESLKLTHRRLTLVSVVASALSLRTRIVRNRRNRVRCIALNRGCPLRWGFFPAAAIFISVVSDRAFVGWRHKVASLDYDRTTMPRPDVAIAAIDRRLAVSRHSKARASAQKERDRWEHEQSQSVFGGGAHGCSLD